MLGDNQFGVQYTDEANPQGFTSLQLVVQDAAEAEAGSTESFVTTVQMGQMFVGPTYEANPPEGQGSGTVSIDSPSPDQATVHVAATTADGVGIDATITCNVVF